jgi:hypothetical protein
VAVLVGLASALFAQRQLDRAVFTGATDEWLDPLLFYTLAIVAWFAALAAIPIDVPRATFAARAGPPLGPFRARLFAAGLGCVLLTAVIWPLLTGPGGGGLGILAYPAEGGPGADYVGTTGANHLTAAGLVLWLAGTALCVFALAETPAGGWRAAIESRLRVTYAPNRVAWAVAAVTLVALYFRVHDLAHVPGAMTSDHTEKLLDIDRVLAGMRPIFFWTNAGREPLQFYYTALLVKLGLPFSFETLKLGMALVGTATIPLVFVLGRRLFGVEAGIFAALVTALAPWHLSVSRLGLRIAWSPFFVALTLILLLRALDGGRRNEWLAVGLAAGIGLHGYTGFRTMALAAPVVIATRFLYALLAARRDPEVRAAIRASLLPFAGHVAAATTAVVLLLAPTIR